jgi:biotin carboxyl carrier protein
MAEEEKKAEFEKLNIDEVIYETLLTEKFKNRKVYAPANPKLVKSFIPGTILKILVRRGRKVEEGDDLLVLEAMKMQNQIKAPISGKISKINVKKGQMVSKNFVMIEFE